MEIDIAQLHDIFSRTNRNVQTFMNMLNPIIAGANDEYERMYFHHIYEEEEQHVERLEQFIPRLRQLDELSGEEAAYEKKLLALLQDINLEKFGQHNFLEHLELAMYHFKTGELNDNLVKLTEETNRDYSVVKDILFQLNERFFPEANQARRSDAHEVASYAHDPAAAARGTEVRPNRPQVTQASQARKGLTVGSLRI